MKADIWEARVIKIIISVEMPFGCPQHVIRWNLSFVKARMNRFCNLLTKEYWLVAIDSLYLLNWIKEKKVYGQRNKKHEGCLLYQVPKKWVQSMYTNHSKARQHDLTACATLVVHKLKSTSGQSLCNLVLLPIHTVLGRLTSN